MRGFIALVSQSVETRVCVSQGGYTTFTSHPLQIWETWALVQVEFAMTAEAHLPAAP